MKQAVKIVEPIEFDLAINSLNVEGHKVKTKDDNFRIHEPAGGGTGYGAEEVLIEFATGRYGVRGWT